MRIYLYEGVLTDYTDGMAVCIAPTRKAANRLMARGMSSSYPEDYWARARARSFPLADSVKKPGLVTFVYGGG